MTQQQTQFFKNNFISFSTLVVLVGFIWNLGKWQEKVEGHIEDFELHEINKSLHMPTEVKYKTFVPRNEFNDIKELLKEIRKDVKELQRK